MKDALVRTSKFLSYVLRHGPDAIGLTLDDQGWADMEELIAAAGRHGTRLDRALILEVVEKNEKKRFALSADGARIRASQGHSVDVDLGLAPVEPPEMLYHGTAARSVPSIREQGLLRGQRRHVHLSSDARTAAAVGARHGRPVVLKVKAGEMRAAGFRFYLSANGVWLTSEVPASYIVFP